MSAQWHSLVSQKLFLATRLAHMASQQTEPGDRKSCLQGSLELALRSRQLMLALIARYFQDKQALPATLEELAALVGDIPEVESLKGLAATPGSWWHHLDQLEMGQTRPPEPRKTVSEDDLIAVATESGPDQSAEALLKSLAALKDFLSQLGERHAEW